MDDRWIFSGVSLTVLLFESCPLLLHLRPWASARPPNVRRVSAKLQSKRLLAESTVPSTAPPAVHSRNFYCPWKIMENKLRYLNGIYVLNYRPLFSPQCWSSTQKPPAERQALLSELLHLQASCIRSLTSLTSSEDCESVCVISVAFSWSFPHQAPFLALRDCVVSTVCAQNCMNKARTILSFLSGLNKTRETH